EKDDYRFGRVKEHIPTQNGGKGGREKDDYRVIWVHRDSEPPETLRAIVGRTGCSKAVAGVHYRDAGLFLEELYRRLISSDPPSRTWYRALPHVPTWIRPDETQSPEKPDRLNAAVGFFGTVDPRRRADCSYVLAAHVSRLDNAHQAIWCDLDE